MIRVRYQSLGCFKNDVDTEVLLGLLEKGGAHILPPESQEAADWIIINTCGFIRDAKEESIEAILQALEERESGNTTRVAVMGCLTQRYQKELAEEFSQADILWGVNNLEELASTILGSRPVETYPDGPLALYDHRYGRHGITSPLSSYLKISEGCDMGCRFCAIPLIRGAFRSRTTESLLEEARMLRDRGVQELNIISQNTLWYGRDRGEQNALRPLLEGLGALGFPWIRLLYLMPELVDEGTLELFHLPGVLPYFDLPFQHVSAAVLERMGRKGNPEQHGQLMDTIRRTFPGGTIRASFIVGYPGETRQDFQALLDFCQKHRPDKMGAFAFSPEEGTAAFDLKPQVSTRTARQRLEKLMDLSDINLECHHEALVGSERRYLPLGPSPFGPLATLGRTDLQAPEVDGLCCVEGPAPDGAPARIRITRFESEMLYGEYL